MKNSLPLLLMLCASFTADAGSLRLELKDGTVETYDLATDPVIRFRDDNVFVSSDILSSEYPRADVRNFTFSDAINTVDDITEDDDIVYRYDGLTFSCDGQPVAVYDLRGIKVADGFGDVSLSALPAGIYIVKTNNRTIKIIRK